MSETAMFMAISTIGLLLFAFVGAIFGWMARKQARDQLQAVAGGAVSASWLYLFLQFPPQVAILFQLIDDPRDAYLFPALAGALLMVLLWQVGVPKKLPLVGRPIANFVLAFEKWHLARSKKRIEKLERDLH